jgi:2-(1,2-epoxy-1,2-dihydrophenyl)acetyl-CoA isomerase
MSLLTDESGLVGRVDGDLVLVQRDGRRATVTLNDPLSLNALSKPLTTRLRQALEDVVADPGVGAVVLTGADPAFSAGVAPMWPERPQSPADGEIVPDPGAPDGTPGAVRWELGEIARLIARSGKPFIAGVNGVAAGAGLALALACDVVIMSHSARLDPASGRVGLLPEVGMSWLLTRRLGYHRTLSLFTRGHQLSAVEAAQSGLIDVAVRHDQLESVVSFWCHVANLAATPDMAKPLMRSATESGIGRAAVMGEFAA